MTDSKLKHWADLWEKNKHHVEVDPKPTKDQTIDPNNWGMTDSSLKRYSGISVINEDYAKPTPDDPIGTPRTSPIADISDTPRLNNPINFSSVGKDQDLRVTPNLNDGKELIELHYVKIAIEQLESRFNAAEAKNEKTDSIQKKLSNMRQQFEELSHMIQPDPTKDQT